MPKFLREIKVSVYGNLAELNFQNTEDVIRWLSAEEPFWTSVNTKSMNQNLNNYWNTQRQFYSRVRGQLQQFEAALTNNQQQQAQEQNNQLINTFAQLNNGTVITSDHDIYPVIVDMTKVNIDVAGLLYLKSRADASNILGVFSNNQFSFKSLFDLILLYARSKGTRDWLLPQRKELTALKNEFQASLNEIRTKFDEQSEAIEDQKKHAYQTHL